MMDDSREIMADELTKMQRPANMMPTMDRDLEMVAGGPSQPTEV